MIGGYCLLLTAVSMYLARNVKSDDSTNWLQVFSSPLEDQTGETVRFKRSTKVDDAPQGFFQLTMEQD